jgi:mannose-6-phosphate isomerase-like protein (cupin superfamily)
MHSFVKKPANLLSQLPSSQSGLDRYLVPYRDGDTELGFYAPAGIDEQSPHDRDEFYFIASGRGTFVHAGEHSFVAPGDALFVAAGIEHRFENFSKDFAAWVLFVGPRKPI